MSDLFSEMLTACMNGLYDGERREMSAELLRRVIRICADVADTGDGPPPTAFIKAWTLRPGDLVWMSDCRFLAVETIESDPVGMQRVEFEDGSSTWYQREEPVLIPTDRAQGHQWNRRRTFFGPEAVDRLLQVYGNTPVHDS